MLASAWRSRTYFISALLASRDGDDDDVPAEDDEAFDDDDDIGDIDIT